MRKSLNTIKQERVQQQRRDLARAQKQMECRAQRRKAEARLLAIQEMRAVLALGGVLCDVCNDTGMVVASGQEHITETLWKKFVRCTACPPHAEDARSHHWYDFGSAPSQGLPVEVIDYNRLEQRAILTLDSETNPPWTLFGASTPPEDE